MLRQSLEMSLRWIWYIMKKSISDLTILNFFSLSACLLPITLNLVCYHAARTCVHVYACVRVSCACVLPALVCERACMGVCTCFFAQACV